MDPSALRQLLAVLREAGAASASFHPDGTLRDVALSHAPGSNEEAPAGKTALFLEDVLPPGAYDPVAKAKREGA